MLANDRCQHLFGTFKICERDGDLRIGLSGAIWTDYGGEVGVAKEKGVVSLIGLEVCEPRQPQSLLDRPSQAY